MVVCVMNLCKCFCIGYTAFHEHLRSEPSISTLGDALVSFLRTEDTETKDMCLAEKTNIEDLWRNTRPQPWVSQKRRWYSAASLASWISTLLALVMARTTYNRSGFSYVNARCLFILSLGFFALGFALQGLEQTYGSTGELARLGFGGVSQYEILDWSILRYVRSGFR
jgi:hypothetical protein